MNIWNNKTLLAFQIYRKMMFIQGEKNEEKFASRPQVRTKTAIVIININRFRFLNEKSS